MWLFTFREDSTEVRIFLRERCCSLKKSGKFAAELVLTKIETTMKKGLMTLALMLWMGMGAAVAQENCAHHNGQEGARTLPPYPQRTGYSNRFG